MIHLPFKFFESPKCNLTDTFNKMVKVVQLSSLLLALLLSIETVAQPVEKHGLLTVSGNRIVNKNGTAVSFAGNSLFWSNDGWGGEKYYNSDVISWLRKDWNSAIVRCAMGVDADGGYLSNKEGNKARVKAVVDAAITNGMYVIIDWHTHNAEYYTEEAINFFKEMAQTYGDKPNVIYEIYNEPINASWSGTIKPYAEKVIDAIRSIDPDNLIIVGTRFYSALVNEPADDPIYRNNVAYTIHFYAGSHFQDYRDRCQYALDRGIALFATEWGTVNADGGGAVNEGETYAWLDFLQRNHISHCNWSINDKWEGASALNQGASTFGNWSSSDLTWSGAIVRDILRSYDYGKLTDEISFTNPPIITSARLSYNLTISYTATETRDLIVSMKDKTGSVLASSKIRVNGSGSKEIKLNLATLPSPGNEYSYSCSIRPVDGNQESDLDNMTISRVTLTDSEPIAIIQAKGFDVMEGVQTEACAEGGQNIAYIDAGDWLSYANISIPYSGNYTIYYRVASKTSIGTINLEKDDGTTFLGSVSVPNTGDWQSWTTISHDVDLMQGTYYLGLGFPEGGFNLNLFAIVPNPVITGTLDFSSKNSSIFIYPSPARDQIYIKGVSDSTLISVMNISGEMLIEAKGQKIDISLLPAGVYFIKAGYQTGRFIKE